MSFLFIFLGVTFHGMVAQTAAKPCAQKRTSPFSRAYVSRCGNVLVYKKERVGYN